MVGKLIRIMGCAGIVLWQLVASAETFEQAKTLSGAIKSLVEEERANRETPKPIEEMSDLEVVGQAGLKVADKVDDISIGTLSAIERFAKNAIGSAAKRIRERESVKTVKPVRETQSSSQTTVASVLDEMPSQASLKDTSKASVLPATSACDKMAPRAAPVNGAETDTGGRIVVMAILVLVGAACLYGITYARVMAGTMVVYVSWYDFMAASAWVLLVPVGYGCEYAASGTGDALMSMGTILKATGVLSAIWMVGGAFLNKNVIGIFLAIPGRVIVALLVLLAWAKIKEAFDESSSNKRGLAGGVLLPLGIALFVFNFLVKPMIGDKRC